MPSIRDRIEESRAALLSHIARIEGERDAALARAEALEGALRDAIEAIDRAEPMRHSPWCNGVHAGPCCEGDYLMAEFMARLRALAYPAPEAQPPPGTSHRCTGPGDCDARGEDHGAIGAQGGKP